MPKYLLIFLFFVSLNPSSLAQKYIKNAKLIARSTTYDGYSIPAQSFLSNISPKINNHGDISFMVYTFDNVLSKNLYYKKANEELGRIVYTAPKELYVSDPSMNDNGLVAFHQYDEGINDGIFIYDSNVDLTNLIVSPKLNEEEQFRNIILSEQGKIGFRATDFNGQKSFYIHENGRSKNIVKVGEGISYLFTPTFLGEKLISKVRLGSPRQLSESRPDEIRSWDIKGMMSVLTKDHDSTKTSLITSFNNSVGTSGSYISFIAKDEKGRSTLYLQKGENISIITQEGKNGISSLEYFTPAVNDLGQVAFRAKDSQGHRSIFFSNGSNIKRLLGEADLLKTDRETAKIYSHKKNPGLSGGISLNNKGEIVFHCLLMTKNDEEALGEAVYLYKVGQK